MQTVLGEESIYDSMNLTLSTKIDLMNTMWYSFDILFYLTFSLHFQRFDPLYCSTLISTIKTMKSCVF